MNRPGTATGNWVWRYREGQLESNVAGRLRGLSRLYGRLPYAPGDSGH